MKFPFFRKRDDGPLRLKLPGVLNQGMAVYFQTSTPPTVDALNEIINEWLARRADPKIRDLVGAYAGSPMTRFDVRTKDRLPLPPIQLLRATRLGELEERRLNASTHAIMIGAMDMQRFPMFGLFSMNAMARAIATYFDGVILDPGCGRVLSLDANDNALPDTPWLPMSSQILIPHSVDSKGIGWITTVGMDKYGFQNLEVRNVPPNLVVDFAPLVTGIAQRLVGEAFSLNENRKDPVAEMKIGPLLQITGKDIRFAHGLTEGGPAQSDTSTATICLGYYPPKPGSEVMLGIMPPPNLRKDPGVWIYQVLADMCGTEEHMGAVPADSETMEIAHRKAMDELPTVKERMQRGLPLGSIVYVKHGFPTAHGDREFMWIAVQTWNGNRISGILANDPVDVPGRRTGDRVEIAETDVFDWMITYTDGKSEGGYTTKVVQSEGRRHTD